MANATSVSVAARHTNTHGATNVIRVSTVVCVKLAALSASILVEKFGVAAVHQNHRLHQHQKSICITWEM